MLRFYSRTGDTSAPLMLIPIDWYGQGRIRIVPLRVVNETISVQVTEPATSVQEDVKVASSAGVAAGNQLRFDTGELVDVLAVEGTTLLVARGVNGVFSSIAAGATGYVANNYLKNVQISLEELVPEDENADKVIQNQWISARLDGSLLWTPLGSFTLGDIDPGDGVDLDLRVYIPSHTTTDDFCAGPKIELDNGEMFMSLSCQWFNPATDTNLYNTFQYGYKVFSDGTQQKPPGNYHKPVLQINFYTADDAAMMEEQGIELPGDDL